MKKTKKGIIAAALATTMCLSGCIFDNNTPPDETELTAEEKLFNSYRAMVVSSLAESNYYIQTDGYSLTTDENGTYMRSSDGSSAFYYIKKGNNYYMYIDGGNSFTKTDSTLEQWSNARNPLSDFGFLTATSLEDLDVQFRQYLLTELDAQIPLNPSIDVRKNLDEDLNKEIIALDLSARVNHRTGSEYTDVDISVICFDGKIREISINKTRGSAHDDVQIRIEYVTNPSLVPSAQTLEEAVYMPTIRE